MKGPLLRFIGAILGLAGLGVIIAEVLKKWQFISASLNPVWVVMPILTLYITKIVTHSSCLRNRRNLPPNVLKGAVAIINIILILLFILAVLSIPFVWFGAIEETARSAN
jgi:hypothetical protein